MSVKTDKRKKRSGKCKKKSPEPKALEFIILDKANEKQKFPHFRKYLKSGHPAMITGEHSINEWDYRKVMHGERENGRLNDTIYPNPNPLDPKPMRVARRLRHDEKKNFSKWRYKWKIKKEKKQFPADNKLSRSHH